MSRKKGSKLVNGKVVSPIEEKGNPTFNLNEVEPTQELSAAAGMTAEDMEFERSIQTIAPELPPISDPEPLGAIAKPTIEKLELLRDEVEDYKPATTDEELRTQVHLAKQYGCDSIEATLPLAKRFCRDPKLEEVGYFIYYNVKVYIEGRFELVSKREKRNVYQVNKEMGMH